MRGLLRKDWELLAGNYKTYAMLMLIACVYLFMGKNAVNFFIAYVTLVATLLVLTTISYDDFEHGMSFLMTLPINREIYVREKYVFGLLSGVIGWAVSVAASALRMEIGGGIADWGEWMILVITYLGIVGALLIVMLPVQFKFGGESGRVVLVGIIMAALILGFLGAKLLETLHIDMTPYIESLKALNPPLAFTIVFLMAAFGMAVSYRISLYIVRKKEF
ncbi:MAG: ABC-2 transporter permease [Eubacteriales bacterium]|nr:ABC-2 transporter permease [Eubacteriales bacterium]